jgi:serine/threonine protein kinase
MVMNADADNRAQDVKAIFLESLNKKTGAARASYLDEACGANAELRDAVESLLLAHEKAGEFLDPAAFSAGVGPDQLPLTEAPGTVIGRYKLLERIGEGGMAVVYMAEQEQPIRRKVALKIIKLGMDTRQVIARFEAERQALAMMDHPSIAKVLDAGATETGRPYFVMELVQGVSITEYCDKNNLSTKDRLALFLQVCNAVQHAHQKGIIHRDIKPSNVMVTHHDGKPVPKVIDFGIAKATNQRLTEKTLFTRYAHIIGTPAYMSPEQAELSDLDIDTRTDIYSLGVLLYELLTGTTPFSEEELRKAGYIEMQRIIREQEPAKPSTKLSTLGETLGDVAKHRGATPDLLRKAIRGDLDWIVMKSLEKDRLRRYEAPDDLATDIQRHLEHRPVLAHAPSAGYRLHKFLRRNRSQAIAVLAAVSLVGIVVTLSARNRHQVRVAEAEGVHQLDVLSEARDLIAKADLPAARKTLRPILASRLAGGLEARILFASTLVPGQEPDETIEGTEAIMERHYRERVQYYTEQIAANPRDPNNYLRRAQQHYHLQEEENVHADMTRYVTVLGQGQFPPLRLGTPTRFRPVAHVTSRYQFVLSAARRESGMVVMSVAFGQKGRSNMKPFEIPMFLASVFGVCFLAGFDAPVVLADFTFDEPVKSIIPVLDPSHDGINCLSYDGLEIHLTSDRSGGSGGWDLWVVRRPSLNDDWGPPENLGPVVNSSKEDSLSSISADGLTLYFTSNRSGGYGGFDIYVTTRATPDDPWGQAVNLGPGINSSADDESPWISRDGLELYLGSYRPGGYGSCDVYVARRATPDGAWGDPVNLGPVVNSARGENYQSLSPNGLLLFFVERVSTGLRPGGYGGSEIWMSRRASPSAPWQASVNPGPMVNSPANELYPRVSPDAGTLYFASARGGSYDYWQAPIIPIVDFNGDGKVDGKEVVAMADNWGQNKAAYDIGPSALGDGVVDVNDLIVLADYIGSEWVDPTLLAHWALDEGAGSVAIDWAGRHDAMVGGTVVWQPEGQIGGALAFDGKTTFARSMSPVVDPGAGPFSVIAWVKGGATGRVIVSQAGAADWLYLDQYGMLTTDLMSSDRKAGKSLTSSAFVIDDQWHRVALTWDGTNRTLQMDGVEVAADTQPNLASSTGGLQFGSGKNLGSGTFWSGLIDDVRVYSRAVQP